MKLYRKLAGLVHARKNCQQSGNAEWLANHTETVRGLVKAHMPSGSGFDSGTKLDFDRSSPNRLVFTTSYHHMNGTGFYDGWTEHEVIVTPDLHCGYVLRITGRDRNDFKAYACDVFSAALDQEVSQ